MLTYLIPLFVLVPLLELWLLVRIGATIGAGSTILLVLVTGVVGASLARREGVRTLAKIQENMARGVVPTNELVGGLLIFVAGLVLITPGVITDAIGFALLIPPIRVVVAKRLAAYFRSHVTMVGPGSMWGQSPDTGWPDASDAGWRPEGQEDFIDVEHSEVKSDESKDEDRR